MKNGINKVTLVGHVGEDPKMNDNNENFKVVRFNLATSDFYKDKDGKEIKKTEWHKIIVWNKQAEIIKEYVKKGDPLYIEGKIQTNSWDDKDGNKRYSTEINCESFLFLSSKASE
jgi:single-strand DNA-binding protein